MSNVFIYGQTGGGSSGGGGYVFTGTGTGTKTITFTGEASAIAAAYSAYQAHSVDLLVTIAPGLAFIIEHGYIITYFGSKDENEFPQAGVIYNGSSSHTEKGQFAFISPFGISVSASGAQITITSQENDYVFADTNYFLSLV